MKTKTTIPAEWLKLTIVALWSAVMTAVVWKSYAACGGRLIYTLDDPYIHMSVSESILAGGYGVNAGESCAPSSSIIFPFILAPAEWLGIGTWGPLVFNVGFMLVAVCLISELLCGDSREPKHAVFGLGEFIFRASLGLLICLALNTWGLVMTGLEHPLHVLLTLVVLRGSFYVVKGQPVGVGLVIAIAALPLVRFEGAALALSAVLLLFCLGHKRGAWFSLTLLAAGAAGWAAFVSLHGLPLAPSSVQLKSAVVAGVAGGGLAETINATAYHLKVSFGTRQGAMLLTLLSIVTALTTSVWSRDERGKAFFGAMVILAGAAHVCFGQYGWHDRYEVYAMALCLAGIILLARDLGLERGAYIGFAGLLVVISAPYARSTFRTHLSAQNIYQQQFQMHRFVVEYWKQPVAVNDLGWVSYHNHSYVMDLYGLGSEPVRKLRVARRFDAASTTSLLSENKIELAMVYDEVIPARDLPASWKNVATLETTAESSASPRVRFYLSESADREKAFAMLSQFALTLPPGATLKLSNQ